MMSEIASERSGGTNTNMIDYNNRVILVRIRPGE
jgi:hypothetical protein